jgi:hypothetical protein
MALSVGPEDLPAVYVARLERRGSRVILSVAPTLQKCPLERDDAPRKVGFAGNAEIRCPLLSIEPQVRQYLQYFWDR